MRVFWVVLLCLGVTSCGDLPQPFAGNPGRRAMMLAVPPPPRLLVPTPGTSLLPDAAAAAAWARDVTAALVADEIPAFAMPARKREWVLRLSATLRGTRVTPRYTLLNPQGGDMGDIEGTAIPADSWAQAAPATLTQTAREAAPQLVTLLQAVEARLKQSDPNSLYNRPARIFFTGVTGAPGDGDIALARGMRMKIADTGDRMVDQPTGADFLLRGTVRLTDAPHDQQTVEIHWIVALPDGKIAGDVAQIHDIARGVLDHFWGDVALAITGEAAGGVHEVITNYSGRGHAAKPAG